jgi:hypothetical protein
MANTLFEAVVDRLSQITGTGIDPEQMVESVKRYGKRKLTEQRASQRTMLLGPAQKFVEKCVAEDVEGISFAGFLVYGLAALVEESPVLGKESDPTLAIVSHEEWNTYLRQVIDVLTSSDEIPNEGYDTLMGMSNLLDLQDNS